MYIPEGTEKRIEVRTSTETKREWKRMIAQIDPELTYEQTMQLMIHCYSEEPDLFERVHKTGRVFDS